MKKLISALISLTITAGAAAPSVLAADSDYTPTMYFRAQESDSVKAYADGNAAIFRSELDAPTELRVNAAVYIDDESLTCWDVHPVWKCASKYAKLENLVDPLPMSDDAPNIAYAYA